MSFLSPRNIFNRNIGHFTREKNVLNPAICFLLSAVMAFSSGATFMADDNISSGDRIIRLTTKDIDGNFTNNDNTSQNKYELEIQKTINSFNEICLEYNVSDFATKDDVASEIELVIPNVSFKDAVLMVNDTNAIVGDPSVVTEGNTARLLMSLNRDYVATIDKVVVNIPFKITKLTDLGDITVNLKSSTNQTISYTWDTVLVDTIENPENLPEFDRFNNGTYFKNPSMKVAKGLYHSIPVRVLSKADEGETLITLEHPSFYFKNYDGTWTLGKGTQKVDSLNALQSKIVDFMVFQIEDSTTPVKIKVNETNLTSTMQLEQTRIILDTAATLTTVKVGESNTIDAVLKLETPFTANNSFKININADSNKFDFSDITQDTTMGDDKSIEFTIPYKTKKAFDSGIVSLDIVTEFEGKTYDIISKDLSFTSKESDTPVDPEPTPEKVDYYVGSIQSIAPVRNGMSRNATFNIVNNSKENATIKVKLTSSDKNVTIDSDHLGFSVLNDTEYTVTANVDANSSVMIPYSINVGKNANTTNEDKINKIIYTILSSDDVIDNNEKELSYTVSPDSSTPEPEPEPEPEKVDYYIEEIPTVSSFKNGESKDSFFTLVNNSKEQASIKVKIKSPDSKVSISSIHSGFEIEGNNEYAITATVKANTSIKIPYTISVGSGANITTEDIERLLTFTVVTPDDIKDNNVKTLSLIIHPDAQSPDPDPEPEPSIKDYYIGALPSITPIANGASRNSTFNVVNNSDEKATINVSIKSSDTKVNVTSTHNGFSEISSSECAIMVDVDANSSVMIPYAISVDKTANTGNTDKLNTLTFSILTPDDITTNNVKTLSYIVTPDKTVVPDPEPDPEPEPDFIDLNEYFDISLITDRTPALNKEITVAVSATKLKNLSALVENPKIELVVTGPKLKDHPTNTYKITKNLPYLTTSSLSSQSISFTPLAEGSYTVTAKVTGTNLSSGGILFSQKQINISSDEGAAPDTPIIGSGKVFVTAELTDIKNNEAVLKITVTNNTDYLLRNTSLTISYDSPVTINLVASRNRAATIEKDFYIGNINKNSKQEFTFPVKINSTGKPNIVVALNSTDLNLDVYQPKDTYNSTVTFTKEPEEQEKKYKVSGIVFDDINGDGLYSSNDQPISSATVHLKGRVGNIVQTMFSYTSGYYSFSNIVPGEYTIEVTYMGLTAKKKITITDSEQLSVNIPLLYSKNNNTGDGGNSNGNNNNGNNGNNNNGNSNNNENNGNNGNNQQNYYKDLALTGSVKRSGNDNYIVDLQVTNSNSLVVTDATLRVTTYNAWLQSNYDYVRASDNSYMIKVPSFTNSYSVPLYLSSSSDNAHVTVELVCPTDLNSSNNIASLSLDKNTNTNTTTNSGTVKGILKKKISDTNITIEVKDKNEVYQLASDVIYELDDEKSSLRKINRAFDDSNEVSVKVYMDSNGYVYKVIASTDTYEDAFDNVTNGYNNKLVDFNNTNTSLVNIGGNTTNLNNTTNTQSTTQTSAGSTENITVSTLPEDALNSVIDTNNVSSNAPSLPKTGETNLVLSSVYQVVSFITGFLSITLFAYAIILRQEQKRNKEQ